MSSGSIILAINLAVGLLIAAAFASLAIHERSRAPAKWMAAGYLLGTAYFAAEAAIHLFHGGRIAVTCSVALLLMGMAAFNTGLARRYERPLPFWILAGVILGGSLLVYAVDDLPRYSLSRMLVYQGSFFVMQALAAFTVARSPLRRGTDIVLAILLVLSALQFLSKPFIALAMGGWGADPQAYLSSDYASISQSMGTVSAIAVALTTIFIVFRDVLAEATAKSEIDTLSGLFNRQGFYSRADEAVRRAVQDRRPAALIICDIDHFKSVNDSLGHSSGDRVISAFAVLLGAASGAGNIAGRVGGEEFAVLLPGSNLTSGKFFAEGVRRAFSEMPVAGLPTRLRFTASFGVAEMSAGETLAELISRADEALYVAKRDGRNRVRVSPATARVGQPRLRLVRSR